jgi:hypothetical protein
MRRLFLLSACAMLCSCAATTLIQADGFVHPRLGYRVGFADAKAQVFVSPDWRVDNLREESGRWTAKEGAGYTIERILDWDEDGRPERDQVPQYDLKLTERKGNGVLFTRSIVLPASRKDLELEPMLRNYAEALSGTAGEAFASLRLDTVSVVTRQYASKVLATRERQIGGRRAMEATIELAALEQTRLDPDARTAKLSVTLVDAPMVATRFMGTGRDMPELRVVLMIVYWNDHAAFDARVADYERFLTSVSFAPDKRAHAQR